MDVTSLLIGLGMGGIVGAVVGMLLTDRRARGVAAEIERNLAVATERVEALTARLNVDKAETDRVRQNLLETERDAAALVARVHGLEQNLTSQDARGEAMSTQLNAERNVVLNLRQQISTTERDAAALAARLRSAEQNLIEQKKLLDDAQLKLRDAFANVSAEALAKNNEAFLHLAKERFTTLATEAAGTLDERKAQIEGLLKPMNEQLRQYQEHLGAIEKNRVESYSMLREQLGTLAETQRTLHQQTNQLVTALRRPNTRGQWGEITLRRLVELAGMSARCDFFEQNTIGSESDDGEAFKLRPDVVVRLPGGREIVIDCKAVLDGFLDAAAAPDDESRKVCLIRHSAQVRARSKDLSTKAYWSQFKRSPEYVVMFLPGEAFLYAACEHDVNLIEDCLKNRVIIATPTTLIALLKAVEFGWRQEEITENAEAIRKHGKELYDRIRVLAEHFAKVGSNLNQAVDSYNKAVGSMETRVLTTARKIGEMGARGDKELPELPTLDVRSRELSAVELTPVLPGTLAE